MEETMRVLTINELMRLTRVELCAVAQRITGELPTFPADSLERANALTSLRNIRLVLARRGFLAAIHGGLRCNFPPNWQSLTLVRFNLLRSQQIG
jgi:hypothetical protein